LLPCSRKRRGAGDEPAARAEAMVTPRRSPREPKSFNVFKASEDGLIATVLSYEPLTALGASSRIEFSPEFHYIAAHERVSAMH
jgi:hypothetical protein